MTDETADVMKTLASRNQDNLQTPLHRRMGLKLLEYGPRTVMTMEMSEEVRGSGPGTIHGGMLATLADVASANALFGAFDLEAEIPVTTDMHIRYYRQPKAGPIRAVANLVHRGRRLLSCECSITDAEDRLLVRSTGTYMVVPLG